MTVPLRPLFLLGLGLVVAACGTIGDPEGEKLGAAAALECKSLAPGDAPIRRMTRAEYNNTIRDLLGDTSEPANDFVVEEEALGFNNQASALGVTQLLAEQYMDAAEKISAKAVADLHKLMPSCDFGAVRPGTCAQGFVETFGKRAFRRPLAKDEVARLMKLYAWGEATYDFPTGIALVIQAMLESPHFLYRVEFGMPDPIEKDVVALTPHEIASRLSYMLWNSMPDDELFAAADAGKLVDPKDIEAEARRMLADPRARKAVANFHTQWLGLGHIDTIHKDATIYPEYTDALRPLWKEETEAFLDYVVFDGEGDVATLLTAPYSFMNADLAAFYGVENGPKGADFVKVELDPTQRAGLLTQGALMAVLAKPNQSSPVHRGKFVRERLLCQMLPPPPNDVKIVPPDVDPNATTRQKFSEHDSNPACAGCHELMDPIGFGFEHYDGVGRWRDEDHGFPVDASGELTQTKDADGKFDGAVELSKRLAQISEVRQCVATQWFRFAYGRSEQKDDACNLKQLEEAFAASGYNIKELLVALTQTDAFRYRKRVVPGGAT